MSWRVRHVPSVDRMGVRLRKPGARVRWRVIRRTSMSARLTRVPLGLIGSSRLGIRVSECGLHRAALVFVFFAEVGLTHRPCLRRRRFLRCFLTPIPPTFLGPCYYPGLQPHHHSYSLLAFPSRILDRYVDIVYTGRPVVCYCSSSHTRNASSFDDSWYRLD